jgi:hypothetical protein
MPNRWVRRLASVWCAATLVLVSTAPTATGLASTAQPALTTDKQVYSPNQVVHFSGTGFAPSSAYAIPVKRPDGSIVKGNGSFAPGWDTVTSDATGHLTYNYRLDDLVGTYQGRGLPGRVDR